jgi:hypothetical protein
LGLIDLILEFESLDRPDDVTYHVICMNHCSYPLIARAFEPSLPKLMSLFKAKQADSNHGPDSHFGDLLACISNFASCSDVLPTLRDLGIEPILTKSLREDTGVVRLTGEFR